MTEAPRIVVVGSANVDYVVHTPTIPRAGETILARRLVLHEGGKGANQAVAAARAGGAVAFIGAVGRDQDAERLEASLAHAGVSAKCLTVAEEPTGMAMIFVDDAGRNAIAVVPGANSHLTPAHVESAMREFPHARTLLVQLEIPLDAVGAALRIASVRGMRTILNPAPATRLPEELLSRVDVLTPNESEAGLLSRSLIAGVEGAPAAIRRLLEEGPRAVVLTLGDKGAYAGEGAGPPAHVPAFPAEAIDTTGAGDVFNGALAVALTEGRALIPAVRFACAAAALSVTREGAQRSAPRRPEIDALLEGAPES